MNLAKFEQLKHTLQNETNKRIFCELDYALQVNKFNGNKFDQTIEKAISYLEGFAEKGISKKEILAAEEILAPIGPIAKKQECLCVAHAHIDINWLWGYNETVAITISTLDTMLSLLDKYPQFTFAQSSGLVYQIVAKYRPDMLSKIKKYIKEGRFEVSATTFVEADKNIPNGEALIRQTLYTKEYLSKLLDIDKNDLDLDFEPDTFGHSAFVPEILSSCGVKYFYHCRGNDMPPIYRWHSPSGKSILIYREPFWYNAAVQNSDFEFIPDFCSRYGVNKTLKVYGAGDHGGGATIRDIETIIEISTYPIMATIRFGTYKEFFGHLSTIKGVPDIYGEQTSVFSGCYSSQSEIKAANAQAQKSLYEQELFCAFDPTRKDYDNSHGVECLLTNQFHDVVTGSGVYETKYYALGRNQEALGEFDAFKDLAIKNITSNINTLPLFKNISDDKHDTAFGAGVGFGARQSNLANYIAYGKERAYAVFNQLNFARKANVRIPLWDYYGDINALAVFDNNGTKLPFVVRNVTPFFYWYHNCNEFEAEVSLPPLGYACLSIREEKQEAVKTISYPPLYQRIETPYEDIVLENKYIKATFDKCHFRLISLIDKLSGEEKLSSSAGFRFIMEDTTNQMTAWYIGRYKQIIDIHDNVKMIPGSLIHNDLYQEFGIEMSFGSSKLQVFVSLNKSAKSLSFNANCDFFEKGDPAMGIPQLSFLLPLRHFDSVKCDVPLGTVDRKQIDKDVPCQSFMSANGVMLQSDGKHGFRGFDDSLALCLLRSSCDPNPLPEYRNHNFRFGISVSAEDDISLLRSSEAFRYLPLAVSIAPHGGVLPLEESLVSIDGDIIVTSISRKDGKLEVHAFNPNDKEALFGINGKNYKIKAFSLLIVKQ